MRVEVSGSISQVPPLLLPLFYSSNGVARECEGRKRIISVCPTHSSLDTISLPPCKNFCILKWRCMRMRECETGLNVRSEDGGDLGGVLDVCQGDGRGRTNKRKPETKIRYLIGRTGEGGVHDAMDDGGGGPPRAERKQLARRQLCNRDWRVQKRATHSAHHSDGMGVPSTLG